MTFKQFFNSSIGRKIIMAFTGLFLISFLVVHATINALIFFNDHGVEFNYYAHFMSHNWIIRIMELGLFIGFIIHIIQGYMLWAKNARARKVNYSVQAGNATSKWYSRSMGLLGTLLLLFLITHLAQFWWGTKMALIEDNQGHNLFNEMYETFQKPWVVIVYVIGCISLCWHLIHGFSSAFQTLGINSPKYNKLIKTAGILFSIIISALFAIMPISMYLGWVGQ